VQSEPELSSSHRWPTSDLRRISRPPALTSNPAPDPHRSLSLSALASDPLPDSHRVPFPLVSPAVDRRFAPAVASSGCTVDQLPTLIGYCISRLLPATQLPACAGCRILWFPPVNPTSGLRRNLHPLVSTKLSSQLALAAPPLAASSLVVRLASHIVCFDSPRRTCSRLSSGSVFSGSRQLVSL